MTHDADADDRILSLGKTIDAVYAVGAGDSPTFRNMAAAAGLDPAADFAGADLSGVDFRDEDLEGFCFRGADLTGCDFRRATGLADDALDGAEIRGCIGLPEAIEARRTPDDRVAPDAPAPHP